jgi:hypothetical protein
MTILLRSKNNYKGGWSVSGRYCEVYSGSQLHEVISHIKNLANIVLCINYLEIKQYDFWKENISDRSPGYGVL